MARGEYGLRVLRIVLYLLAFCCAVYIATIFSLLYSVLRHAEVRVRALIAPAVLAALTALYTLFIMIFSCCTGARLTFLWIGLDLFFAVIMLAVAIINRGSAHCEREWLTLDYPDDDDVPRGVCTRHRLAFVAPIIAMILLLITALLHFCIRRRKTHDAKTEAYPTNDPYQSMSEPRVTTTLPPATAAGPPGTGAVIAAPAKISHAPTAVPDATTTVPNASAAKPPAIAAVHDADKTLPPATTTAPTVVTKTDV